MPSLAEILRVLVRHDVRFIVVGGLAAALQGAPVHTDDLDVVYDRRDDNLERLLAALRELDAVFRTDPTRRIAPDRSHLRSDGHKLLRTPHGVLDLLATIEHDTGFDDLLPDADVLVVAGLEVRVLSLERLRRVKAALDRPKDRFMLAIIDATLAERARASGAAAQDVPDEPERDEGEAGGPDHRFDEEGEPEA